MGTIKIAVYLDLGTTSFTVILNNRAKINILHLSLAVKLRLTVIIFNHRHLASANKSKSKFIEIAENTPVWVGGFHYKTLFFVINSEITQNCILERLFKMQALVGYQNKQDGSVMVSFILVDWKQVVQTTGFSTDNKHI